MKRLCLLSTRRTLGTLSVLAYACFLMTYPAHAVNPANPSDSFATTTANEARAHALIDRELQAWQKQDFSIAAPDWLPDGELISPGGHIKVTDIQGVITDYFKHFRDLQVTVKRVFVSADGNDIALEWDWGVTRIRDGKQGLTHDAIHVHLENGKIKTWSEFFDLGNSVDAQP